MRLFIAATAGVICAVAGVLLFFTEVPIGYGFAVVAVALLSGVVVAVELRRPPRR